MKAPRGKNSFRIVPAPTKIKSTEHPINPRIAVQAGAGCKLSCKFLVKTRLESIFLCFINYFLEIVPAYVCLMPLLKVCQPCQNPWSDANHFCAANLPSLGKKRNNCNKPRACLVPIKTLQTKNITSCMGDK